MDEKSTYKQSAQRVKELEQGKAGSCRREGMRSGQERANHIESGINPENHVPEVPLDAIISVTELQAIMDDFWNLTHMPTAILDLDGKVLEATGWQDICIQFHRKHPETARNCTESDLYLEKHLKPGEYVDYKCRNGLWDAVTPLYAGARHLGNIYAGQFFYDDEKIDEDFFVNQAETYGFDKDAYMDALRRVPRYSRNSVQYLMRFLVKLAAYLSRISLINIKLEEEIVKRRQAEGALRESEAHLRTLIRTLPDLVWLKDQEGTYLSCNPRFESFFGAKEKDIIGRTDYDFVDRELADFFRENDRKAMAKGGPSRNEEKIPFAKDGHYEILDTIKTPMYRSDGRLIGVLGIGRDITERKQAEKALQYRIELEKLISAISTRFVGISSDRVDGEINRTLQVLGEFTRVDRSYLFSVTDDGTLLTNTHEWCAPGITPQKENLQQLPAATLPWWTKKLDRNEILHIPRVADLSAVASAEKELLQFQDVQSLLVVPMTYGKSLVGFIGFDVVQGEKTWAEEDITLLKTIGDVISHKLAGLRAEAALLASEEKYRHLFENAQIGLFLTRVSDGLFLEANQTLIKMFGFDVRDEFVGRICVEDYCADPEARSHMIARLKENREVRNFETRFRKKDGSILWARFSGRLYQEKDRFEGVAIDITESKQAEAEKARLEEQYRQAQKVEAIGRLAGGVAHDMNNLLTPILGYGEMLLDELSVNDGRRQYVEQIVQAGLRSRDMVRQLLAFGRKQTLEYKPLNINRTIEGFEKLLRRTIREDIALKIIPAPGIQTIRADIGQLEEVIMNLSVNAQDAMPDGGRLTLETAMVDIDEGYTALHPGTEPGRYVMLSVSDTGCGMDEETREHIFEPFFSTKGEQGTGLGLATVYGIVKQHEGNIWVYSEPGRGTTFRVYLPVSGEAHVEKKAVKPIPDDLHGSETILLVEDNEQVRNLGHAVLTQQGYTVLKAKNSEEALAALASHKGAVHLLLTDVILPGVNGREMYLKAAEQYPDLKVLYMSGYTDEVIAQHGVLNEGVQFIQKPFTVHALAAKVREVLGEEYEFKPLV